MNQNLNQQLASWKVEIDVPPRFQANVWADIAARESRWSRWLDRVAAFFHNPVPAAAFVTLALTLSMATAFVHAQTANERNGRQMEARYMESINPLAHTGGHS